MTGFEVFTAIYSGISLLLGSNSATHHHIADVRNRSLMTFNQLIPKLIGTD
jgi:hypothetical protein